MRTHLMRIQKEVRKLVKRIRSLKKRLVPCMTVFADMKTKLLPPGLFDTASSIYYNGDDGISGPFHGGDANGSDKNELEDALLKQRPNCVSGFELTKSRDHRYQIHIQHRLNELEVVSRGICRKRGCWIESLLLRTGEDFMRLCLFSSNAHKIKTIKVMQDDVVDGCS
ncbi:probable ATP-dependent DNA helicase CHR12 isoform X4 [Ziziphus jujuba]|uniref:Probable ATP-dependent DNA helicase CHR12 isoform X4 n=1 Tax=Ziziphus jujuba TaxID=326968 RepID=A0ABM3I6C9_ZIZJJ|nr:probable ATP-dependent DNA helicase CHR12 isoform X4 [Ziziphus jujuba]